MMADDGNSMRNPIRPDIRGIAASAALSLMAKVPRSDPEHQTGCGKLAPLLNGQAWTSADIARHLGTVGKSRRQFREAESL